MLLRTAPIPAATLFLMISDLLFPCRKSGYKHNHNPIKNIRPHHCLAERRSLLPHIVRPNTLGENGGRIMLFEIIWRENRRRRRRGRRKRRTGEERKACRCHKDKLIKALKINGKHHIDMYLSEYKIPRSRPSRVQHL